MKKHFVRFYSPGTLFAEINMEEIDSWDIAKAVTMSKSILQRYSATPYGFNFITKQRRENELDSEIVSKSPMYYLGGKIETLKEIKKRNNPKDRILISNMERNGYERVLTNCNSWKWTQPLNKDDVVLDMNAYV